MFSGVSYCYSPYCRVAVISQATTKELQCTLENHGYTVSASSVLRCCRQLGWTHCRSAYCQLIRESNKLKRLDWARKYLEEGSAGFRDVIFTDQTSVQLECYRRFLYQKTSQFPRPKPRYVCFIVTVVILWVCVCVCVSVCLRLFLCYRL